MKYSNFVCAAIITTVCLSGFNLPFFVFADPISNLDRKVIELRDISEVNYFGFESMDLLNLHESVKLGDHIRLASSFYPIQIQSPTGPVSSMSPDPNITLSSNNIVTGGGSDSTQEIAPPRSLSSESNDSGNQPNTVKCEGMALCVMGEVIKVVNAKTFYANIDNKVYKVDLSMIELPVQNEQAMRYSTIFTRDTCLGNTVLIDQDDGQRGNGLVAQVYCSPTKNLNALLLDAGYVELDKSQCQTSEFSKLTWAKSRGC
jgi:hypothetical protein